MADRITETSYQSGFSRLTSSFRNLLVGFIFAAISVVLLWINEGRAVRTARGLAEGAAAVVSVNPASIDKANENKLIHFSGPVTVSRTLEDAEFGIKQTVLKLVRKVEMYQWKEKSESRSQEKLGGGRETVTTYTYDRVWSEESIPSANFKEPQGHHNPEGWRVDGQTWLTSEAKLGAFDFPQRLVERMGEGSRLALAEGDYSFAGSLPPKLYQQGLYFATDPSQPQVGDLRVTYTVVKPGDYSVVSQQSVTSVIPFRTKAGTEVDLISPGIVDAKSMFEKAVRENNFLTWALRFVGWLLMFMSFRMLFEPLVAIVRFIPFLGGVAGAGVSVFAAVLASIGSLLIVGIAWMYYRPMLTLTLFAIAAGIILYVGSKYKKTAVG